MCEVNEEHCFISIPAQHATRIYNSGVGGPHSLVLRLEKLNHGNEDGQTKRYVSCIYIYIYTLLLLFCEERTHIDSCNMTFRRHDPNGAHED